MNSIIKRSILETLVGKIKEQGENVDIFGVKSHVRLHSDIPLNNTLYAKLILASTGQTLTDIEISYAEGGSKTYFSILFSNIKSNTPTEILYALNTYLAHLESSLNTSNTLVSHTDINGKPKLTPLYHQSIAQKVN